MDASNEMLRPNSGHVGLCARKAPALNLKFTCRSKRGGGITHRAHSLIRIRAHARIQSFYVFAFTSSSFWRKVLIKCALRVKVSPFRLHLFFAIGVLQCVEIQLVEVKVKVNARFAFTLNRLIYSLLRGKVKSEGKKGKFAECAGAYIRVGACPARRVKGMLCGVGRF